MLRNPRENVMKMSSVGDARSLKWLMNGTVTIEIFAIRIKGFAIGTHRIILGIGNGGKCANKTDCVINLVSIKEKLIMNFFFLGWRYPKRMASWSWEDSMGCHDRDSNVLNVL
jgi:hypothetical protein